MTLFAKKIVVAACTTIALGIACEAGLRMAGVVSSHSVYTADQVTFENQPGIWEPDQKHVSTEVPSLPFTVKTNSAGYRGDNFDIEKSPDEFRVLMVGDSFTFGNNVNETETLPYRLQRELSQSCKDQKFLSINAGIPGSTIRGQAEMIRRGMLLKPDTVILVFTETDVIDLANPLWDQYRENRDTKARFPVSFLWPLVRDTSSWALLSKIRNKLLSRQRHNTEESVVNDDDHAELRAVYMSELRKINLELASDGVTFVAVTYPGNFTVREQPYDDTTHWAMREFADLGIPTVELLWPLQKAFKDNVDGAYLLPVDSHPSRLGYQVAASAIAQRMLSDPRLQGACRTDLAD